MRYIFLRLWYLYLKFIFKLSYFINKLVFNPSFFTNYNISKVNYFYFLRNNSARSFLFEDKKGNHDLLKFSSISSFFSLVHDKVGGDDIINFIVLLREFGFFSFIIPLILIFLYYRRIYGKSWIILFYYYFNFKDFIFKYPIICFIFIACIYFFLRYFFNFDPFYLLLDIHLISVLIVQFFDCINQIFIYNYTFMYDDCLSNSINYYIHKDVELKFSNTLFNLDSSSDSDSNKGDNNQDSSSRDNNQDSSSNLNSDKEDKDDNLVNINRSNNISSDTLNSGNSNENSDTTKLDDEESKSPSDSHSDSDSDSDSDSEADAAIENNIEILRDLLGERDEAMDDIGSISQTVKLQAEESLNDMSDIRNALPDVSNDNEKQSSLKRRRDSDSDTENSSKRQRADENLNDNTDNSNKRQRVDNDSLLENVGYLNTKRKILDEVELKIGETVKKLKKDGADLNIVKDIVKKEDDRDLDINKYIKTKRRK